MTIYGNTRGKSFLAVLLALFFILAFAGCGSDSSLDFKTPAGETVTVTVDDSDDFSVKDKNGRAEVLQKQKVMLTCEFIDKKTAQAKLSTMDQFRDSSAVHSREGDSVAYEITGQQGRVSYYLFPVTDESYVFGYTYLPWDAADAVKARISFTEKK